MKKTLTLASLATIGALTFAAPAGATNQEQDPPPVDVCDTSTVKGSVAKWLASHETDGTGCFAIAAELDCGTANVTVTEQPQPGYASPFRAVWLEGDVQPTAENLADAKAFPATFPEDHNGGTVTISWFLVGPEGDWLRGSEHPNFWDGTSSQLEVDTDCEEAPPVVTEPPVVTDPPRVYECTDANGIGFDYGDPADGDCGVAPEPTPAPEVPVEVESQVVEAEELAFTGVDSLPLALAGAAMVAGGAGLLAVRRRAVK